jgi:hypothetical protein
MALSKNGSTFSQAANSVFATNWTSNSFAVGSGSNRILVVSIGTYLSSGITAGGCVTGVKWGGSGGVALTKIGFQQYNTVATREKEASIWYLLNPTAQTSTLYVTFADSINEVAVAATVWDGAIQSSPFSGGAGSENGWTTTHSVLISSAVNSIVIDAIIAGGALTCSQTQDANLATANNVVGQSHKDGAVSVTMTWTSANCNHAMYAASLAPYVDASHINMALAVGGS